MSHGLRSLWRNGIVVPDAADSRWTCSTFEEGWKRHSSALLEHLGVWMPPELSGLTIDFLSHPILLAAGASWFLHNTDERLTICPLATYCNMRDVAFPLEPTRVSHRALDYLERQGYTDRAELNLFLAHLFGPLVVKERQLAGCVLLGPSPSGKTALVRLLTEEAFGMRWVELPEDAAVNELVWARDPWSSNRSLVWCQMTNSMTSFSREWSLRLGVPITLVLPRRLDAGQSHAPYDRARLGEFYRAVLEAYWSVGGPRRPRRNPRCEGKLGEVCLLTDVWDP